MSSWFAISGFNNRGSFAAGEARAYFYDREDVWGEVDGEGTWARSYVNGPGIDDYISMTVTGCGGEAEYFYRADGLGSVTSLTGRDDAGVVAQYEYGPFGEAEVIEGEAAAAMNPHQYTGRDLDAETGLMYYRSRYYSPGMGRFVGEDIWSGRITAPETYYNKYLYVSNSPANHVDPYGDLGPVIAALIIGGIVLITPAVAGDDGNLFIDILDNETKFAPFASDLRDIYEAVMGKDMFTGEDISTGWRVVSAVCIVVGSGAAARQMLMEPNNKALRDLVNQTTKYGKRPLTQSELDTIRKWADEYGYPGFRGDVDGNWAGGPHINMPQTGRGGHLPVEPGVK